MKKTLSVRLRSSETGRSGDDPAPRQAIKTGPRKRPSILFVFAQAFPGEGSGTFFGSIMANLPNELAAEKGT